MCHSTVQVFVKTLTDRTFRFQCSPTDTVADVKLRIELEDGVPADQQRLLFDGTFLDNDRQLASYGIRDGSTLVYLLRLRGC
jgi:hypothetical protein